MTVTAVHSRYFRSITPRSSTIVVAASDAYSKSKQQADFHCDGVNDEIQIQAANDALPVDGGVIQLTEGKYKLARSGASQIELSSGSWLRGLGKATRLELADSIDETVITNENATPLSKSGTVDNDITVSDFYVDGNKINQGAGVDSLWCVGFSTVDNLNIFNLFVENGFTAGIRSEFCNYVKVYNNRVHNSADDCIAINEETKFGTVQNNVCTAAGQGGKSYGAPYGIEVQDGAEDIAVRGNTIAHCGSGGIQMSLHTGKPVCKRVTIQGNTIKNNSIVGIDIAGESGSLHTQLVIGGNTITQLITELDSDGSFDVGPSFISLETVTQAVSGATGLIISIDTTGDDKLEVEVTSGTFDTTNLVTGDTSGATMTPGTVALFGHGIIASYMEYTTINGNTIEANKIGMKMNTSPINDIVISNNSLFGNGSPLYGIQFGNTLNRISIIGNIIRDFNWRGILFDAGAIPTGCHITDNLISGVEHGSGACLVWDMTSAVGANNVLGENYLDATTTWAKTKETGSYVTGVPTNWTDRNNIKV